MGSGCYATLHSMTSQPSRQIAQITGANLKAARAARGLTQRQVAEAVGATSMDVSRWETGRVEPGPGYRQKLAAALFDGDLAAIYATTEAA